MNVVKLSLKCNLPKLIACPPMDKSGTGIELFRLRLVIEDIDMHPRQRPRNKETDHFFPMRLSMQTMILYDDMMDMIYSLSSPPTPTLNLHCIILIHVIYMFFVSVCRVVLSLPAALSQDASGPVEHC